MAVAPIYGKSHSKISGSGGTISMFLVCSNDDHRVTLTYFTTRTNLVTKAFLWEKVKTVDFLRNYFADLNQDGRHAHIW